MGHPMSHLMDQMFSHHLHFAPAEQGVEQGAEQAIWTSCSQMAEDERAA